MGNNVIVELESGDVVNVTLPKNIYVTTDPSEIFQNTSMLILAVPSHAVRSVAIALKPLYDSKIIIVNLAKGFEEGSFKRMSEIVFEELGDHIPYVALSGPNIASEILKSMPAGTTIAGNSKEALTLTQKTLSNRFFKAYINDDLIGVEIGGAVKNIIAIAAGFVEGKQLGTNARAQLVSRGMAEMLRLGKRLGARERTFLGLSGLGDLITTCFSPGSRNFSFGYRVGKGMSVKDSLEATHMVVEGVKTTRAVYGMAKKLKIDMPITSEIYYAIYEDKSPDEVLGSLLSRPLKHE